MSEDERPVIDNRRTFCDHCSLRTDLPGFINEEHAEGNADRIRAGDYFPCHMIHNPMDKKPNQKCLGAVLAGGAICKNRPAKTTSRVYESLEQYVAVQKASRRTNEEILNDSDVWLAPNGLTFYGFWHQALAGNWMYFLTTLEENASGSVYLFFDQAQEMFGPLERKK